MSDKEFRVEATQMVTNWVTFWITAKSKQEAIDKAKNWDYDEIDMDDTMTDQPELEIEEVIEQKTLEVEK